MNFKKTIGMMLVLSLMATAISLAACTSSESSENTEAAVTDVSTEPVTVPEETEQETTPAVEVECNLSISDQEGTPISNVTLYLTSQSGTLSQITVNTDDNGKATVTLWEGTYTLTYEDLPEGHLTDDTRITIVKETTDYAVKVLNNIPNGTQERPFSISSEETQVKIPANTSYTYVMFNAMNRTIVIENTTLKVNYKSTEYVPDATGTVSVLLTNESPRDPGYFTLINTADADVEATVRIESTPGSMENPYEIEKLNENVTATVFKDTTVYYKWVATQTGILMVTSHTDGNYIAMSNLANSTVSYFTNGGAATYLNVTTGDEILISVASSRADKDGAEVVFALTEHTATSQDPVLLWEGEFNFTLAAGVSYSFATEETATIGLLTIKGSGIEVSFNGEIYTPDEKGKIEIQVTGGAKNLTFTVENKNDERKEIVVSVVSFQQPA